MKLKQFSFAPKIICVLIFFLCLIHVLPINIKADGSDAGNYYKSNIHLYNKFLYYTNYSIEKDRFSYNPYTVLYPYTGSYKFIPDSIYLSNVVNSGNKISYNTNMPIIKGENEYIDTRIKTSGSIKKYLDGSINYSGINKTNDLFISLFYYANTAYGTSYSIDNYNKLNSTNYFYNKDFYLSNFYLGNNTSQNFNISINFNNRYADNFISKDSKIYSYVLFNSLKPNIIFSPAPAFEALRILDYNDLHGDQHNESVLNNKKDDIISNLKDELSNLQDQANNDAQYDNHTKSYLIYHLDNILNYNEKDINNLVKETNINKSYDDKVLTYLENIKNKTSKDMKHVLNNKVLSMDKIPNLNFGKQSLSYMGDTIARVQNNPYFKIKSFNNGNWHMTLSLSDMTDGKDLISSNYFQGNNSSYNNKNKIFNFSGNDGVKDVSLNNLSINIPNSVKLHSGTYKGNANWNLVNGPK